MTFSTLSEYSSFVRTKLFLFLAILSLSHLLLLSDVSAAVTVTAGTNGTNISADKASNATSPAYTTLGNIIIDENATADFPASQTNRTFILTAPTNWMFNTGAVPTVTRVWGGAGTNGTDTTIGAISLSTATLSITISTDTNANRDDRITISGLQVRPLTGNLLPSSGAILRTCANSGNLVVVGVTCNATNFASLSMITGALSSLFMTLPGQTFVAGQGNTGSPSTQTGGLSFTIPGLRAIDQFFNVVTSYTGSKTISYSGPSGTPTYTTGVSFTNGVSTTTLTTLLRKAETTTLTASGVGVTGFASSSLTIATGSLYRLLLLLPGENYLPGTLLGKAGTLTGQVASIGFTGQVYGVDSGWNIVPTATHTIHIASSDTNAVLPSDFSLLAGVKSFFMTLFTPGSFSVTSTDVTSGAILSGSSTPVVVTGYTDLRITEIDETHGTAHTGDIIGFAVHYINNSPRTVTGAFLQFNLGTGLVFQSSAPTLVLSGGLYYYTGINLVSGASSTLYLTAMVYTGVTINTNVILTGVLYPTISDLSPLDNTHISSVHIDEHPSVNLSAFKVANVATALPGGLVSYTIDYVNHTGYDMSTGTLLTDTLSGLTYLTSSLAPLSQSGNIVTFDLGNVAPGVSSSFVLTATVNTNISSGTIVSNTVFITGNVADDDLSENTDIANVTVLAPVADLSITKTSSLTGVEVNDLVAFTIHYVNNGPQTATGVVIHDVFGTGMDFVSSSPTLVLSGGDYYYTGFNLASGASGSIIITGLVTAGGSQITGYTNSVSITSNTLDNNLNNNEDSVTFFHLFGFDLFVNKTISTGSVVQGQIVVYTINYGNLHDYASGVVTVEDTLPNEVDFVSASTGIYDSGTHTLTFTTSNLEEGHSGMIVLTGVGNNTIVWGVPYANTVTISAAGSDVTGANNNDAVSFIGEQYADLLSSQSSSVVGTLYSGQIIVYTLTYENDGPSDIYATLDNYFSPAVTFLSASTGTYNTGTHELEVASFFLPAGTSGVTVTITGIGNNNITSGGIIVNTGTFETSISDPNLGNNTSTVTHIGLVSSDLSVSKLGSTGYIYSGDLVSYLVTYHNAGPSNVTNATIIDALPSEVNFVTSSLGTYSGGSHSLIVTGLSINVGQTGSFVLTGIGGSIISGAIITNNVSISSANSDTNMGNNSDDYSMIGLVETIPPTATVSYNPSTATSGSVIATLTGISEPITITNNGGSGNRIFTGNGSFTFEFEDLAGNTGTATATVSWIDTTKPTGTVSYNPGTATSGNVVATLTGFSETGIVVTNNGGNTGYTFTGNGTFTFNFRDAVGNTGTATATVSWIDTSAPTGTVSYNPGTATSGNVVATLTGFSETGIVVTNNGGSTGYTFTGNGAFTFNFRDAVGNTGTATATVSWIDTTKPTGTVTYNPSSLTSGNVLATLTGFSETGIVVTNNGGSTGYTFTGNGNFTFTFEDLAGNTGNTTATVTWIDKTGPTASVTYNPSSLTSGNVLATLTGFSETGIVITNNGGLTGYLFTGNGNFTFNFVDTAGNTGSTTATVSWIDSSAPTATVSYSPSTLTNGNVLATLTGFSETGVVVTNNGGLTGRTFTGNGSFTFNFVDTAGNTGSTTATVTWIDKTGPTATISYDPAIATGGIVVATLTGFSETGIIITNNGGLTGYLFTGNGSFTFEFEDAVGNTGSATATVNWIFDYIAPTATVEYNPASLTNTDVVAILTGLSEPIIVTNNGGLTGYTFTGDGVFTFEFEDLAGNTGSATATVNWIDKIVPMASVEYDVLSPTSGNVLVTLTGFSETGVIITNNSGSTGYTFVNNGVFVFEFEDAAGNTGSVLATVNWIDKVSPTASIEYDISGPISGSVVATLTGESEAITITNNGSFDAYIFTGNGSFTFEFIDAVGNTGSAVATVSWIDTVTPTTPSLVTPTNGAYVGSNVNLSWTGSVDADSGISGYSYQIASDPSMSIITHDGIVGTNNTIIGLADSVYYWWVRAFDNANNYSSYSQTGMFTVDTNIPSATFNYSPSTNTSGNVVVSMIPSELVTVTNNSGLDMIIFTGNGSFTFEFVDSGGLAGSGTAIVSWIDKTAPSVPVLISPINSETGSSTRTLLWGTSTDIGLGLSGYHYQLSLDNGFSSIVSEGDITSTGIVISGLANASYYWRVLAYDLVMNQSSYSTYSDFIVDVDSTAPTAVVIYNETGATTGSVIATLTGFSETVTGVNSFDHTFTSNGSFTFSFQDLAGNSGSVTATVTWIDTTSPTASILYDPAGATSTDVTATLTGFSESGVVITNNGGLATYTFTGNGSFVFEFEDAVGNIGTATATVTWIVAPTVPVINNTIGFAGGGGVGGSISFDSCPEGDYSTGYYDGDCGKKPIKRNILSGTKLTNPKSQPKVLHKFLERECDPKNSSFTCLLMWGRKMGLTTAKTSAEFGPYKIITRQEAAKYLVLYSNIFDLKKRNPDVLCTFSDIKDARLSLRKYITRSCEKGIFDSSDLSMNFLPKSYLRQFEAVAALVKMMDGEKVSTGISYRSYYEIYRELVPNTHYRIDSPSWVINRGEFLRNLFDVYEAMHK